MFGCYRKGDANDPDTYVAAIAAILADYEPEVIRQVTDPRYGLPRRLSWMPTAKEVADECEIEQKRADSIKQLGARTPIHRIAGPKPHRANVFVPPSAPQYAAMLERSRTADPMEWRYDETRPGIWVSYAWMVGPSSVARTKFAQFTDAQLAVLYPPRVAVPDEAVPFD